jgi:hypothetical protein
MIADVVPPPEVVLPHRADLPLDLLAASVGFCMVPQFDLSKKFLAFGGTWPEGRDFLTPLIWTFDHFLFIRLDQLFRIGFTFSVVAN